MIRIHGWVLGVGTRETNHFFVCTIQDTLTDNDSLKFATLDNYLTTHNCSRDIICDNFLGQNTAKTIEYDHHKRAIGTNFSVSLTH